MATNSPQQIRSAVRIFTCRARSERHHAVLNLLLRELVFIQEGESGLILGPGMTLVDIADCLADSLGVLAHAEARVRHY